MIDAEKQTLPSGPAWASVLAAAIGCFSFAVLVDLCEASARFKRLMNFYTPAGDLSGKSTIAVAFWLVAWTMLHLRWRKVSVCHTGAIATASVILIVLAVAMTFPPFFNLMG